MYDPISLKSWIFGLFILLGTISACLFPLWPPKVRDGAYYLSIAGTCLIGLLFVLYIGIYHNIYIFKIPSLFLSFSVRCIIFIVVWSCTLGKQHFWIFPNLTEDCGFIDSFIPLYSNKNNRIKR